MVGRKIYLNAFAPAENESVAIPDDSDVVVRPSIPLGSMELWQHSGKRLPRNDKDIGWRATSKAN